MIMMNVREALEVSRTFGFLGPGPVDGHIRHAEGFAAAIEQGLSLLRDLANLPPQPPAEKIVLRCADLGTGGGVPGLALLEHFPAWNWVFVDSAEKRMSVVNGLVDELGFRGRCEIRTGRAEILARWPELRESFDVVVARGFAGPAVTAECAAPLLRVGGLLIVSDPPTETGRWNDEGLATLGLSKLFQIDEPFRFFGAVQNAVCPDRYPRRVGIPSKRPLF